MKLITNCKHCQKEIRVKSMSNDRPELAKEMGNEFTLNCEHCLRKDRYSANEVKAKESKSIKIFSLLVFLIGTGFLACFFRDFVFISESPKFLFYVCATLTVPAVFYGLLTKQDRDKVRDFNRYWS